MRRTRAPSADGLTTRFQIDAGRGSPCEGAVRAEAKRRDLVDRAWDVKLGITDEALAACDEVIERYGLDDGYGATAFAEKYLLLRAVHRYAERKEAWREIWTCIDRPPMFLWFRAGRKQRSKAFEGERIPGVEDSRFTLVSGYLAKQDSRALDDLRVKIGLPLVDKSLGNTPTQRYRKLTSRVAGIGTA
jgi:hypothetical protein